MGEPLDSEYSTPKCRRWARAWLERPFLVSNQAPHSWQTMSLVGSTSSAAHEQEITQVNQPSGVTFNRVLRDFSVGSGTH